MGQGGLIFSYVPLVTFLVVSNRIQARILLRRGTYYGYRSEGHTQ